MEALFCGIGHFFKERQEKMKGKGRQAEQGAGQIGQAVAQKKGQGAEKEKIDHRAGQHGQHHVQPQHPLPGIQRVEEESQGHQQPEEQIQHSAQCPEMDPDPEHPEAVVKQPHGAAQRQGGEKGGELPGDGYAHLSGRGGRAGCPGPGGSPHRKGSRWCPPPSGRRRPGSAFRCAGPPPGLPARRRRCP